MNTFHQIWNNYLDDLTSSGLTRRRRDRTTGYTWWTPTETLRTPAARVGIIINNYYDDCDYYYYYYHY